MKAGRPSRHASDKTFTMAYSVASSQRSPAETSRIDFAGREVKRRCVVPPACGS